MLFKFLKNIEKDEPLAKLFLWGQQNSSHLFRRLSITNTSLQPYVVHSNVKRKNSNQTINQFILQD